MSSWTLAREEQLRSLHAEGLSFAAIARIVGGSRNAAIGKAKRLGLAERGPGPHRSRPRLAAPQPLPPPPVESPPVTLPGGKPVTLLELLAGQCRYAFGDSDYTFCARKTVPGKAWCPVHFRAVYAAQPKKRSAA